MAKDYTRKFQIEIIKKHFIIGSISAVVLLMFFFFIDTFYNGAAINFIQKLFGHDFAFYILRNQQVAIIIALLIFLLINFLVVEIYALQKISNVFSQMKILFRKDNKRILLDDSLKELEDDFNALKQESLENERKAIKESQHKIDMIAYLAHDIKTPLASVIGYLNLLEESEELSQDMQKQYTHLTLEKAYRLEKLINEFFDIAKLNQTDNPLNKEDIHLHYLLQQMKEEFYPITTQKNQTIEIDVDPNFLIYADANKIARVFNNILKNAFYYGYEDTPIHVQSFQDHLYTHIIFINQGPTIPQAKIDKIFEQFYRLDESRSSQTGGSGLGLSIAKMIVQQHQGFIKVKSEDNLTSFDVMIPIHISL
ncbi:MAG: HAMP domain-containing sensor histidine kinase [Coprobacillus sp.]